MTQTVEQDESVSGKVASPSRRRNSSVGSSPVRRRSIAGSAVSALEAPKNWRKNRDMVDARISSCRIYKAVVAFVGVSFFL